jgi:DHA3 family macrolide efflux protein-like MFS transporter
MKNKRAIILLLLANSISGVAQGISMLAIPWYFITLVHEEALFTKVYFLVTSASLVWGVYAGTLVDRYNRKNIFLAINVVGMIVLGGASIIGYAHGSLPWIIVGLVFATTVFIYNIHFPTLYGFAQEITAKEDYGKVTSQLEVQGQLTWTIAGGLASMLLSGVNGHLNVFGTNVSVPFSIRPLTIYEIFTIDAVTYIVALLIIWQIRTLPVADRTIDRDPLFTRIRTGMGYLKRHPVIFLFGNASLFVFLTIIVHSTLVNPMYVDHFLHQGGDVYALSDMVFSMGALLAGFVTTRLFAQRRVISGLIGTSILAGMMYFVHVYNSYLPWYFLAYFVVGFCNSAGRVLRVTFLFSHIPNSVIGRTNSVFFVINVAMRLMLTGLFALPLFHQGINIIYANAVMGAICIIGGILIWMQKDDLEKMHEAK